MLDRSEEEKLLAGELFMPGHDDLRAIKLRCHKLCTRYNLLFEDEVEARNRLVQAIFAQFGEGSFIQGPMQIHYGTHTYIGKRFFGNFNLVIQDDAEVHIGDRVNFGPNVTIVTPLHPLLPDERNALEAEDGSMRRLCWAKPVKVEDDCWLAANVVVQPGVTIGRGSVIGAGSVVTKDIPPMSLAYGNPCRVIRTLSEADSMAENPTLLGDYKVPEK